MASIRFNVYDDSPTGHSNVTFIDDDGNETTIGASPTNAYFAKLAIRQLPGQFGVNLPNEGKYDREKTFSGGRTGTSVTVEVGEKGYQRALDYAQGKVGKFFDYSLGLNDCTDLVQEVYKRAGFDGGYGRLFSPEDVAKSNAPVWSSIGDKPSWNGKDRWSVVGVDGKRRTIMAPPPTKEAVNWNRKDPYKPASRYTSPVADLRD